MDAVGVVDHDDRVAGRAQDSMELGEDLGWVTDVVQHALAVDVIDRPIGEGNDRHVIAHLEKGRRQAVQGKPRCREVERRLAGIDADRLAGVTVDEEPHEIVAGAAAVVEDRMLGVISPQAHESVEERVLGVSPVEIGERFAGRTEWLRAGGVVRPVCLGRSDHQYGIVS